jgi:hypothetical protein
VASYGVDDLERRALQSLSRATWWRDIDVRLTKRMLHRRSESARSEVDHEWPEICKDIAKTERTGRSKAPMESRCLQGWGTLLDLSKRPVEQYLLPCLCPPAGKTDRLRSH